MAAPAEAQANRGIKGGLADVGVDLCEHLAWLGMYHGNLHSLFELTLQNQEEKGNKLVQRLYSGTTLLQDLRAYITQYAKLIFDLGKALEALGPPKGDAIGPLDMHEESISALHLSTATEASSFTLTANEMRTQLQQLESLNGQLTTEAKEISGKLSKHASKIKKGWKHLNSCYTNYRKGVEGVITKLEKGLDQGKGNLEECIDHDPALLQFKYHNAQVSNLTTSHDLYDFIICRTY